MAQAIFDLIDEKSEEEIGDLDKSDEVVVEVAI